MSMTASHPSQPVHDRHGRISADVLSRSVVSICLSYPVHDRHGRKLVDVLPISINATVPLTSHHVHGRQDRVLADAYGPNSLSRRT